MKKFLEEIKEECVDRFEILVNGKWYIRKGDSYQYTIMSDVYDFMLDQKYIDPSLARAVYNTIISALDNCKINVLDGNEYIEIANAVSKKYYYQRRS